MQDKKEIDALEKDYLNDLNKIKEINNKETIIHLIEYFNRNNEE